MEQIYTDLDGSWSDVNAAAEAMRDRHGIKFIFADPSGSKNKNARGEKLCRDGENAMKALMIHYRLPVGYWDYALASAFETRRLFPITRNIVSPDGDGPSCWELATKGRVSHGMAMKSIGLNISCGATAIISRPHLLGSNVQHRGNWTVFRLCMCISIILPETRVFF
eukprot:SAG31_NODE_131_length_23419_cov_38.760087_1_plen_167_part_00